MSYEAPAKSPVGELWATIALLVVGLFVLLAEQAKVRGDRDELIAQLSATRAVLTQHIRNDRAAFAKQLAECKSKGREVAELLRDEKATSDILASKLGVCRGRFTGFAL